MEMLAYGFERYNKEVMQILINMDVELLMYNPGTAVSFPSDVTVMISMQIGSLVAKPFFSYTAHIHMCF